MRRTRIREILFLVVFWTLAAAFIATFEASARGFQRPERGLPYDFVEELFLVLLVTALAGTAVACFDVLYLNRVLRRRPFGWTLVAKTSFYVGCIVVVSSFVVLLVQSAGLDRPASDPAVRAALSRYWLSGHAVLSLVYWGVVVMIGLFVLQVSEKFGQGVLTDFLLGRYHRPKEEERIFMFMDLRSSTTYAEQLGHIRYSRLIQDCFYDLTDVVAEHHAMIYQYVGDEVVLTWDVETGIEEGSCLRLFGAYDEVLRGRASYYEASSGFVPEFKAGVNAGVVTVAEVGEIKKELAYHGDVLNTASRIQSKCNPLGRRLLVSEELKQLCASVSGFEFSFVGEASLKGKTLPVRLYEVSEAGQPGPASV